MIYSLRYGNDVREFVFAALCRTDGFHGVRLLDWDYLHDGDNRRQTRRTRFPVRRRRGLRRRRVGKQRGLANPCTIGCGFHVEWMSERQEEFALRTRERNAFRIAWRRHERHDGRSNRLSVLA